MEQDKIWPKAGDRLIHKFRKKSGQVVAEVLAVDKKSGLIELRIEGQFHPSLSAAAQALSGSAMNGSTYWDLKKQNPKR